MKCKWCSLSASTPNLERMTCLPSHEHMFTVPEPSDVLAKHPTALKALFEETMKLCKMARSKPEDSADIEWIAQWMIVEAWLNRLSNQNILDLSVDFLVGLARSKEKYTSNRRMLDTLHEEVRELEQAYLGKGDIKSEAFDVAVAAYRIATEGDAGGNRSI